MVQLPREAALDGRHPPRTRGATGVEGFRADGPDAVISEQATLLRPPSTFERNTQCGANVAGLARFGGGPGVPVTSAAGSGRLPPQIGRGKPGFSASHGPESIERREAGAGASATPPRMR